MPEVQCCCNVGKAMYRSFWNFFYVLEIKFKAKIDKMQSTTDWPEAKPLCSGRRFSRSDFMRSVRYVQCATPLQGPRASYCLSRRLIQTLSSYTPVKVVITTVHLLFGTIFVSPTSFNSSWKAACLPCAEGAEPCTNQANEPTMLLGSSQWTIVFSMLAFIQSYELMEAHIILDSFISGVS